LVVLVFIMSVTPLTETYHRFLSLVRKAGIVGSVIELLQWDQEVVLSPKAEHRRSQELGVMAALHHELLLSDELGRLLEVLRHERSLSDEQQALVREVAWDYDRASKVPNELVGLIAETTSQALPVWRSAREKNDFSLFAPVLEKIISLKKEYAAAINPDTHPYEVLFQDYEPGIPLVDAASLLEAVKKGIIPLLGKLRVVQQPDGAFLHQEVPVEQQVLLNKEVARLIGYDFEKGRLDTSTHPFTGWFGRITTRYSDGWLSALFSTIHEAGHGMYEHNLPEEFFGTPLGEACSLSVHESQSRLWENVVGRSLPFWRFFFPRLKEAYAPVLDNVAFDEFVRVVNKVEPGFIRVEADEVTYSLHIILRFQVEQELITGKLLVKDLPQRWARLCDELGLPVPPSDKLGVLQDVHWSHGSFGYFPTYVLGSVMAAQLFAAAKKDIPFLDDLIARGSFKELRSWLKEKVHVHGRRFSTKELVERATGKPLSADDFLHYLREKYARLYGV